MNKESNSYIILFSVVMVVVVGVSLAIVAQLTKPFQDSNVRLEKMQNILSSVGISVERSSAEETYTNYIKKSVVYKLDGTLVEDQDAFDVDLAAELKKPEENQFFPLYECTKEDGKYYIIPMRGKGLWDAVWGYVSLKDDGNSIAGAIFDHKGETPGLGAEISKEPFQKQFADKKIADAKGNFMGIEVSKPGKFPDGYEHGVDGISGGTITSTGVNDMLKKYLQAFKNYLDKNAVLSKPTEEIVIPDTLSVISDTLQIDTTTVIIQ